MSEEVTSELTEGLETVTEQVSMMQELFDQYLPVAINFGLRLVLTVIVFLIGAKVIKWIRKIVRHSMQRANADTGVTQFLDQLLKIVLYFVLIMFLASSFGVDTTSVMALVGSAGLTIGLAFQGSLSNFAGGVLILLLKPFKVGDYIVYVANNLEGTVSEIQIFYTHILTLDNRQIVIPNGNLSDNTIINVSAMDKRRMDLDVGVSYNADLKLAKEVAQGLLDQDAQVLKDEEHVVVVDSLGESAVNLKLRFWVRPGDYWEARYRLTEEVKLLFDEKGIEIPFNQLDVHMITQDK